MHTTNSKPIWWGKRHSRAMDILTSAYRPVPELVVMSGHAAIVFEDLVMSGYAEKRIGEWRAGMAPGAHMEYRKITTLAETL